MTDAYVQKKLTDAFFTLNDFSGKPFIKYEGEEKPVNVYLPNRDFEAPKSNQFFVLDFLPGVPEPAAMGTEAANRWAGIFQIDVCTPLGKGEAEANDKYEWLSKLFARGRSFDTVRVMNCYRALSRTDSTHYTTVVRIEWTADLER
ncbi:MAG: DUF4128 domain-containing protein [Treponema sp.]|jgi:hypothetical protein|nr:DUF4128 domain-containing protein [Treponema sp.]